jgi:hypothetical protein
MTAIGRSVCTLSSQWDQLLINIPDDKKGDSKDDEKIVGECSLLHKISPILKNV